MFCGPHGYAGVFVCLFDRVSVCVSERESVSGCLFLVVRVLMRTRRGISWMNLYTLKHEHQIRTDQKRKKIVRINLLPGKAHTPFRASLPSVQRNGEA